MTAGYRLNEPPMSARVIAERISSRSWFARLRCMGLIVLEYEPTTGDGLPSVRAG